MVLPEGDPIGAWAAGALADCYYALRKRDEKRALLDIMLAVAPQHARTLELQGNYERLAGDPEKAIEYLERALDRNKSFQNWESLAEARLTLAHQLRGTDADRSSTLYKGARAAARSALELANPGMAPFVMQNLALVELALGNHTAATSWVEQAIAALQSVPSSNAQALLAPPLYVGAGEIYYRTGQRQVGLAYMDQGVGMAFDAGQRRMLEQQRREVLAGSP